MSDQVPRWDADEWRADPWGADDALVAGYRAKCDEAVITGRCPECSATLRPADPSARESFRAIFWTDIAFSVIEHETWCPFASDPNDIGTP